MPCWKGKGSFQQSGFGRFPTYRAASKPNAAGTSMLLDRPIPKALFYSHVRLEAKRNALDASSCFGTDRTSTQAAAQDPLRKEEVTTQISTQIGMSGKRHLRNCQKTMVDPNGLEPSTSSVSSHLRPERSDTEKARVIPRGSVHAGSTHLRCLSPIPKRQLPTAPDT